MKFLAVSDLEDQSLEYNIRNNPKKFKNVNYIFSCGDLPRDYLEYITDSIHKSLYFVSGNHFVSQIYGDRMGSFKMIKKLYRGKGMRLHSGGVDMHGRVEVLGDYILVGFGGSLRYNSGDFQFEEMEMERLVNRAINAINKQRFKDFVFLRKKREVIVMSHAPVAGIHDKEDRCHTGFKSFRDFIYKIKPKIWLHGHVHFEGQQKRQETLLDETLVVNVYPSRIIEFRRKKIKIKQVYE